MSVQIDKWLKMSERTGEEVHLVQLKNKQGIKVELSTFGGIFTGLWLPDRDGVIENILLTYEDELAYYENELYLNATIGPVAGRIFKGKLLVGDDLYELPVNNGVNCLHSGEKGMHQRLWTIESSEIGVDYEEVTLKLHHKHLEDGFPGNMDIRSIYRLTDDNELTIIYKGSTDRRSTLNLTNHNYYNLSGAKRALLEDQLLFVNAEYYLEVNEHGIPQETLSNTFDSLFNFTELSKIGKVFPHGIDNPFCLAFKVDEGMPDIEYADPASGRLMSIRTNQEAVVIYTNNGPIETHRAICFETQGIPNTIYEIDNNTPYYSETSYRFGILK